MNSVMKGVSINTAALLVLTLVAMQAVAAPPAGASGSNSMYEQSEPGATAPTPAGTSGAVSGGKGMAVEGSTFGESNWVSGRRAGDLQGMGVVNSAGTQVGKVKQVAMEHGTGRLVAVVSVGGILGIGAQKVAVPLRTLTPGAKGELLAPQFASEDELKQQPAYIESHYTPINADEILSAGPQGSEFSAFEKKVPGGGPAMPGSGSSVAPKRGQGTEPGIQPGK
jgi:PRC-barrel domain